MAGTNLYAYVNNMPTVRIDPLGLEDEAASPWYDKDAGKVVDTFKCGDKDTEGWEVDIKVGFKDCAESYRDKIQQTICDSYASSRSLKEQIAGGTLNKNSPMVTKWFGALTDEQFAQVKAVFDKVVAAIEDSIGKLVNYQRVTCMCECPEGVYASNPQIGFPGTPATPPVAVIKTPTVRLCPDYFTKLDAKGKTAVFTHEMTHIAGGTKDLGYWVDPPGEYQNFKGETVTLDPADLIQNADTFESFLADLLKG